MMVEHEARLHEATVKDAEQHAASFAPKKARRKAGGRSSKPTTKVRVDPEVMAAAKGLLRPGLRLRIVNSQEVIVENDPRA